MTLPSRLNESGMQGKIAEAVNLLTDAVRELRLRPGTGIKLTATENGTTIEVDPELIGAGADQVPRWQ